MTDFQQGDIVSVAEKPDRYVVGGASNGMFELSW